MKINNIAELKTRIGVSDSIVSVLGYYLSGDNGGGDFYWDNSSTELDNGGTIIQVTGVSIGRWKRVYSNQLNARWFGAKGDGVTNDTSAIQKCCSLGIEVIITKGIYLISSTITIESNLKCIGDVTFLSNTLSNFTFFYLLNKKNIIIDNVKIVSTNAGSNIVGIKMEGVWNSQINNFSFICEDLLSIGIDMYSSNSSFLSYGSYNNIILNPFIVRGYIGIRTQKTISDTVSVTHLNIIGGWITSQNYAALQLKDSYNCLLQNIALDVINNIGFKFDNSHNIYIYMGEYNSGNIMTADSLTDKVTIYSTLSVNKANIVGDKYSIVAPNFIRLQPSSDASYYTEFYSNYSYGNPFEIKGKFGGGEQSVLSFQADDGIKFNSYSSSSEQLSSVGINSNGFLKKLNFKYMSASSVPTTGTWSVGDYVKNSSPSSGGVFGWVCVTSGSPGTWKGFGAIL